MTMGESGTLHHTCYVVQDIEKMAKSLAESLAIRPWNFWTIEPAATTVYGKVVPFSFRLALAQVGGSSLELIAPDSGESIYVKHLETKGEGFHHNCIAYATLDEMHRAKEELDKQGRKMAQSGSLGELGEFCYFDIPEISAALELLYLKELPPPEKTLT